MGRNVPGEKDLKAEGTTRAMEVSSLYDTFWEYQGIRCGQSRCSKRFQRRLKGELGLGCKRSSSLLENVDLGGLLLEARRAGKGF